MLRLLREFGGFSSRLLSSCPSKVSSCRCSDKDQFSLKAYAADEQGVLTDDEDLGDQDAAGEDRVDGNYTSSQTNIPRTIIVHNSPPKAAWDWLILLLVVYVAVMTPYLAAFRTGSKAPAPPPPPPPPPDEGVRTTNESESGSSGSTRFVVHLLSDRLILVDFIVDITFLVDMVVNFRTTYLRNGELVANPRMIAINYLKGWFLIDAVSAIPFDVILSIVRTSDTMTATGLLKTPRLLRLLRVARRIDQYSEYGASVLLLLMASFTLIAHWLACIFYAIAQYERKDLEPTIGFLNRLNVSGSTFEHYDPTSGPDIRSRYISSLYFTFTILTSVGFGNISPETNNEKVFSIFAMMLGSLMSAAVFGNVSSIMLRLYQGTEDYHEKTTSVKEFIKFHRIPGVLARRLLDSNQRTWWETSGVDMAGVLRSFPDGLQADICLHLNRTLLNKCPAFHNASPGFLRALSMKLKTVHIPPGDAIVHQGDQLPSIYFVGKGTIEISRDNIVCAILGTNDVFGEDLHSALLEPRVGFCRSGYLVRALSYCDLHKISVIELLDIVSLFAEFSSVFRQKFQVTFDLRTPSNESRDQSKARLSYLLTEEGAISSDEDDRHLLKRQKLEHYDEEEEEDVREEEERGYERTAARTNPTYAYEMSIDDDDDDMVSGDVTRAEGAAASGLMWDTFDIGDGMSIFAGIIMEDDETLVASSQSESGSRGGRLAYDDDDGTAADPTDPRRNRPSSDEDESLLYSSIEAKLNDLNRRMHHFEQQLTTAVDAILEILTSDSSPD